MSHPLAFIGDSKKLIPWIADMFWLFKNASKVRESVSAQMASAPICPRCEAKMTFESEQEMRNSPVPDPYNNRMRHYGCRICDYKTHTIYSIKRS